MAVVKGDPFRDRVACALCNVVLNRIATKKYRDSLDRIIRYGIASATRDAIKDSIPENHWGKGCPDDCVFHK